MKLLTSALFALLLVGGQAVAEVGAAYYGIQSNSWRCDESLTFFEGRQEKALSFLWLSFGESLDCVARFFELPGPKYVVIHGINEASRRKRTLHSRELLPRLSTREFRRAIRIRSAAVIEAVRARYQDIYNRMAPYCSAPDAVCAVSTGLEHSFTPAESAVMVEIIRSVWPWDIVDNPVGGNAARASNVDFIELHSLRPHWRSAARPVANNDGADINLHLAGRKRWHGGSTLSVPALRRYIRTNRDARAVFLWWRECNGKDSNNRWVDQRRRRNFVTSSQIAAVKRAIRGL